MHVHRGVNICTRGVNKRKCTVTEFVRNHYQILYGFNILCNDVIKKGKGSPYSITERRVPELIPVLGSQPASDVSHKLGSRLPLLSARLAVTLATLNRAATNFTAW